MSPKPTILFDVTRLAIRVALAAPTGIDRTTEAYAAWLLSRADIDLKPVCTWGGVLWPMPRRDLEVILGQMASRRSSTGQTWRRLQAALARRGGVGHEFRSKPAKGSISATFRRYVPAIFRSLLQWRPLPATQGAIYLNVSHFGLEQPRLLDRLSDRGVKSIVMVHDLIPIDHPEYCSPNAARLHLRRIEAIFQHASLVIANSHATAEALKAFADKSRSRCPDICVAPLGLQTEFLAPESDKAQAPAAPYFVCVGTLEPRKNLTFLLTIWRRLAERLGEDTPPLVLVGQRGWENESIIDQLERAPPVLRHVYEVSDLSDDELAQLLTGARALLAPSFSEGFNLPVNEAIALGVPVIASDIPVHREFAPDAHLIDPIDGLAWLSAIEAALRTQPGSAQARRPAWSDHFTRVSDALVLATRARDERLDHDIPLHGVCAPTRLCEKTAEFQLATSECVAEG